MQVNQEKTINRLHNRHYAKIIDKLEQVNAPAIIIDTVKQQFSFYTKDIKEQVLSKSKDYKYEKQNDYNSL
jgi:type IV secretory pathway VirB6-like protein